MAIQRILITGGAGFVGSNLAIRFRELSPTLSVLAVDNLKRRGSALNLPRLADAGVAFIHADVRSLADMDELPDFDLLIDAAAEPSVHAGVNSSPRYVLDTNLAGTINALEAARRRQAVFIFLSTSRVYSINALNELPFHETDSRFAWTFSGNHDGVSERGITEDFSTAAPRSYYGTSKLASELLVQEFAAQAGMRAIINRCGVLAGPWQMGKTDQGVVSLWVIHHCLRRSISYIGFGGSGKQVRDVLHIDDLFDLLVCQLEQISNWNGQVYNVGGGAAGATSLTELTNICQATTGNRIDIGKVIETSPVDVRIYFTDTERVDKTFGWRPRRSVETIVSDIAAWLEKHGHELSSVFGK